MSDRLLREYLNEVLLTELHVDRSFLNHLRRMSGKEALPALVDDDELSMRPVYQAGARLANNWVREAERARGAKLWPGKRSQVVKFVMQRFPALVMRHRGNIDAASQTMYNILNARFNDLKANAR